MFGQHLSTNYAVVIAMILFVIGFANLLLQQNMIKKIIGLNIMDTSVYLFLALRGYISNRLPPISIEGIEGAEYYINPVPSGLVLTGIVVGVSVTGLMLALTICMYEKYHTLDLDEISAIIKREEK